MVTHSSVLAWRIPWIEEPGELQSMVLQRVEHDWAADTFTFQYSPKAKAVNHCRINFWDRWINLKIYQNYYNVINCNRFKSLTYWKFFILVLLPAASLLLESLLLFICNIKLAFAFKWWWWCSLEACLQTELCAVFEEDGVWN